MKDNQSAVREVEAKYWILDEAAVTGALQRYGVTLSEPVRQDDQAYAPVGWRYGMSKIGVSFARLRTEGGRHLFTVKRPVDNELACVEHETVVADRDQMHACLLVMGFVPTVRIVKTRRTGRWASAAVCLDSVDGLGLFIELELLVVGDRAGESAQDDLHRLVMSLGVPVKRTTETYDSLLRAAHSTR